MRYVPAVYQHYYEPFLGGGALYFALQPRLATLSDINDELMNCYLQVAASPSRVSAELARYVRDDSRSFYNRLRDENTSRMSGTKRAARFIYLNKAAFNGMYRVSKAGHFNVPYGPSVRGPAVPSPQALVAASDALRGVTVTAADFEKILATASEGDFVYLDPPYPPLSRTAYFTHYSPSRFGWDEQARVARAYAELDRRRCLVMLSNADHERVVSLYRSFEVHRLEAIRWIGSNGDRFKAREIVVTNYCPAEVR